MKLLHLSDLHLGKRVNGYSMLEDQAYILQEILTIVEREQPDAVLIAGDVYDKPIPGTEAVSLLDYFLTRLSTMGKKVFLISGNHDSPERVAFGGKLMERSGIYMSKVYDGKVEPIVLSDPYGEVAFYLLPFIKPAHVRAVFPEEEIASYTDALDCAIAHMQVSPDCRNVLLTHQFVTGATRCDSEEISVGGSDNVDVRVFAPFDYVALGHIHGPQNIGSERVRYCGTPLKYSFSEVTHEKSVSMIELKEKGEMSLQTIPLEPLRDMIKIRGTYEELVSREFYKKLDTNAYIHATLLDEEEVLDAIGRLRAVYPNIMSMEYDNKRSQSTGQISGARDVERKSEMELFAEFYELQNNQPMSGEQEAFVKQLLKEIKGEKE